MPISRHTFAAANSDDDDSSKLPSYFDAALNIMLEPGAAWPIKGNTAIPNYDLPLNGDTRFCGGFSDGTTGSGCYLLYNSTGAHRLIRYTPTGVGSIVTLLEWQGLNLSATLTFKDGLNGGIIGGLFVYLDAVGEARCINLARAASGAYTPAYLASEPFALHLIKVPPVTILTWTRTKETTGATGETLQVIQRRAYQFSYRYRYVDGEETVLASYSSWIDVVVDPATLAFNVILLALPTAIPVGVLEIDIVVREPDNPVWKIAQTLRRDTNGLFPTVYRFYGVLAGGVLTDTEGGRLFESLWPCNTLSVARSRVHAAGFLEGYPTPEPAFTATVITTNPNMQVGTLYTVTVQLSTPQANGPNVDSTVIYYYKIKTGTYPNPASTYSPVTRSFYFTNFLYSVQPGTVVYTDGFVTLYQNEVSRTVTQSTVNFSLNIAELNTFHESSPYPISVQFYDALGRSYGAAKPTSIFIPARAKGTADFRSIQVELTTTGASALNLEIPAGAYSYQFLVGVNSRTRYFLQGQAADVLGYLGQKTVVNPDTGQTYDEVNVVDVIHNTHERVLVDIGNFTAAGLGYVWEAGSEAVLRFLNEGKEFKIAAQRGDYLEVAWNGYPDQSIDSEGRTRALIEIYVPNLTDSNILYERGPRMLITRTVTAGVEQRDYSQRVVVLEGDCFLVPLSFPIPDRSDPDAANGSYVPPSKKSFVSPLGSTQVECMVPPYRLVPSFTNRTTVIQGKSKDFGGAFLEGIGSAISAAGDIVTLNLSGAVDNFKTGLDTDKIFGRARGRDETSSTRIEAETAARSAASLIWLNPSYGGRITAVVPRQLQQVYRGSLERFSGQKQIGNLINGLSVWEAGNQYDKLPQEDGAVTSLVLADQNQTGGKVMLALLQHGAVSLYLGQQPIQVRPDEVIISQTNQVIGAGTDLKGAFGCVDPASVVAYDGKVFWWCRERQDLIRYNNGTIALGLSHKYSRRLREAATLYGDAPVRGCFDPRRQEYWLIFDPTATLPGLTLIWSEKREAFSDAVSWQPEAGVGLQNELVTAQAGILYRHTPTSPIATFGGVFTAYWIKGTTALPDDATKRWMSMQQRTEGSLWNLTELRTDTGQVSRTRAEWWERREGVWLITEGLRRNELTPGFPTTWQALDQGDPLISPRLTWTLTGIADNPQPLASLEVSWKPRAGQGLGVQ